MTTLGDSLDFLGGTNNRLLACAPKLESTMGLYYCGRKYGSLWGITNNSKTVFLYIRPEWYPLCYIFSDCFGLLSVLKGSLIFTLFSSISGVIGVKHGICELLFSFHDPCPAKTCNLERERAEWTHAMREVVVSFRPKRPRAVGRLK